MRPSAARYLLDAGNPVLAVDLEGGTACLCADSVKPYLLAAGWVFLGTEFPGTAAAAVTPPGGEPLSIPGCTDDPAIVALYRRFLADANSDAFAPGPAPIPVIRTDTTGRTGTAPARR